MLAIMALLGVGLVQVYSSSYIFATETYDDALFFFRRQAFFVGLSFLVLLIAAKIPFRWLEKWGWTLWVGSLLGILLTFVPGMGVRVGGAARWINLSGGFRFEPSEMAKLSFCLFFGSLLMRKENFLARIHWTALLGLVVLPLALLLKQPDFGSFAIIAMVGFTLLFVFGLKWRYIFVSLAMAVPAFYMLVMNVPYRRARVLAFLDPWSDPEAKGFQAIQSMLSFFSGGLAGQGLGEGQGKLFFLPEAHTDFTLAVLGEEMGFIGFILVLALYGFVIMRCFQLAMRAESQFQKALAVGVGVTFALSVFINAGVVMGLLPTKGLTLPFLSYGGSSLLVLSLFFGFILNLERTLVSPEQKTFFRRANSVN
jgi:cell division protein FtsW